jgi:two-component system, OmpR family, response regulator CpxR
MRLPSLSKIPYFFHILAIFDWYPASDGKMKREAREMEQLLVIDDDVGVCRFLADYLEPEGFGVDAAHDGETGLQRLTTDLYDLVILDIILPQMNGLEVLRRLRKDIDTPVIILTSCGDELDRVVGLEIGADDYVSKPFSPRELLARSRAILRRGQNQSRKVAESTPPTTLMVGDVEMQLGTRLVVCQGERVNLTNVEFDLLAVLLTNAGQTVLRNDLRRIVLGRQPDPYDRSVDVHISRLRKKLGHQMYGMTRIQTIRSAGYLYSAPPAPTDILEIPPTFLPTNNIIG